MLTKTHSNFSSFKAYPPRVVRTLNEALNEISRPCGRFATPFSIEEKMASFITRHIQSLDTMSGQKVLIGDGVPLNWAYLAEHLHKKGVATSPRFSFPRQANDRPKIFNAQIQLSQDTLLSDGRVSGNSGFGAAFEIEEALSKTIGETLERYFLSVYKRENLKISSYSKLSKSWHDVLDIHQLNGFLPWQKEMFPQFCSDDESPLHWIKGEEFITGKKTWLPAQLVFWNYQHGSEKMLHRITTSGCAGHFSKDEAVLAGLLENIQRDGFFIYWLNHISPHVLDVSESNDPDIQSLLEYLKRYRLQPIFLDTTTDVGIPSLVCALIDSTSETPVVSIGSGCGFDLKSIVQQSILEALLINEYAAQEEAYHISEDYKPFTDANLGRKKRLTAWKGQKMLERFSFFTAGPPRSIADFMGTHSQIEPHERLPFVLEKLRNLGNGYEVYVYEVRDPILKQLGYHVVRTIVPQLFPLYLWEHAAPLDSKRLREVPRKLGYEIPGQMNPWPHPFP
jgi:ribosomal protein S12 methylthiotransferase accessory factor